MRKVLNRMLWVLFTGLVGLLPVTAMADAPKIGIVIMHGKGGSPDRHVDGLARELKKKGYEVANIEMPWSGRREYDVDTDAADAEIDKAIASLRAAGAQKVFVSGHSQGGAFAVHYGATHPVDGVIAIAPGGSVGGRVFKEKLGKSVGKARKMVEQGKGDKKVNLEDYEGSKGIFSVRTTPAIYLSWFSPDGAMNTKKSVKRMGADTPVLWLVAKNDYKGLRKVNIPLFDEFPGNPHNKMMEPDSDHIGAPYASRDIIVEWTTAVASAK